MLFWLGVILLLVAAGASLALALDHFDIARAPGCGFQSGCEKATRGPWGRIPGVNWPVSLLGLAYFVSLLGGWITSRGITSALFRALIVLGGIGSLFFAGVMITKSYFCPYCAIAHAANFVFIIVAFIAAARNIAPVARGREFIAMAVMFIAATAVLAGIHWQTSEARRARAEAELAESTKKIIEKSEQHREATPPPDASQASQHLALHAPPGGFTSRWRVGPENAPIRIVIFSDFQCTDCQAFEHQVRKLLLERSDVSIAARHFPLDKTCNQYAPQTIHANACWAARAAEAGGILQGNDGFWKMHNWLFDRGGSFTNEQLTSALPMLGFEPNQFISTMMDNQTLEAVKADIEEGYALGIFFTPMVFINGVELRGFYNNPNALKTAVDALAATNPQPGSPTQDRPPLAAGKLIGDWREGRLSVLPPKARDWTLGSSDAPIKVWVWGDFQHPLTSELDQLVRSAAARRQDIHYVYRHYPMDQSCNPNMRQTVSNSSCWAARAAEAAGSLGGDSAYWKMHEWLMKNQSNFNDEALRAASPQLGLDPEALLNAMKSPQVQAALAQDITSGKALIVQGVPTIYVNGRWVPRWKLGDIPVLELIFDEVRK